VDEDLIIWLAPPHSHQESFKTRLVCILDCIDQPTTWREKRSITTAKYNQPSIGANISDVRNPDLIRFLNIKILVEMVFSDNCGLALL